MGTFFNNLINKFKRHDVVMRIILINVIVFIVIGVAKAFFLMSSNIDVRQTPVDLFVIKYLALPSSLAAYILQPWSIVTSLFLHHGIGHIFTNMFMLYIFGSLFHEYLGSKRLVTVFLWGGIVGGLLFMLLYNIMPGFAQYKDTSTLAGASAGVMAILVATATLLPRYEISLFGLFSVRLPFIAMFWAAISMVSIAGDNAGGEIAHVGGALFGFFYIKAIYSHFGWISRLKAVFKPAVKPKRQVPNMKVYEPSRTYIKPNARHKPSQEEVDMILDKISASGYESLNQSEKDILFKASNPDD